MYNSGVALTRGARRISHVLDTSVLLAALRSLLFSADARFSRSTWILRGRRRGKGGKESLFRKLAGALDLGCKMVKQEGRFVSALTWFNDPARSRYTTVRTQENFRDFCDKNFDVCDINQMIFIANDVLPYKYF